MLKTLVEWLEREYPFLVNHPWLASVVSLGAAILAVAAWLTTAWRLGKWYYVREIQALRAENAWLRIKAEHYREQLQAAGRRFRMRNR
jgi:hypothetical protein